MDKIEHIGIAVNDIKEANLVFKSILGKVHYKTEYVESEDVLTSFFDSAIVLRRVGTYHHLFGLVI